MAGFIGFLIVMVIIMVVGKLIDVVGFTYEVMMTEVDHEEEEDDT